MNDELGSLQIKVAGLIATGRVVQWIVGSLLAGILISSFVLGCRAVDYEERIRVNSERLDLIEAKMTQFEQFRIDSTSNRKVLDSQVSNLDRIADKVVQDFSALRLSIDTRLLEDERVIRDLSIRSGPIKP